MSRTDTMGWTRQFPQLAAMPEAVVRHLEEGARRVQLPEGAQVFGPGMVPDSLVLLLSGRVRVQQVSESGREIVLYRVQPGESCVITTACLLADAPTPAEAITETPVDAIVLPRAAASRWRARRGSRHRPAARSAACRPPDQAARCPPAPRRTAPAPRPPAARRWSRSRRPTATGCIARRCSSRSGSTHPLWTDRSWSRCVSGSRTSWPRAR